ncbi:MAG: TIGR02266 family protein [Deltaproteobacteria bacterium]|nr:MAG: TIGR02266 family protein [Deltaproteobacteria bacterium]
MNAPRKKVLLVDDVELFVELEKTFFHRANVTLLVARNGLEALDLARRERPDLIFMDLFMPEMDGDVACARLKEDPDLSSIPVVMVTHGGRDADLQRCRDAGCDDILLKPVNRHKFVAAARRFIGLEDRVAPRVDARIEVRYANGGNELTDYSLNMSTGGLFLETDRLLPVETELQVSFNLPDRDEPVRTRARVAWANEPDNRIKPGLPPGMGLQFLDLSLDDLQDVRSFVREHLDRILPS